MPHAHVLTPFGGNTRHAYGAGRVANVSRFAALLLFSLLLAACSSIDRGVPFVPPAQRQASPATLAWPTNHYLALAYHDVEDENPDQTFVSVGTTHLQEQFAWLHANGYQPVSVDQIFAAADGGPALPSRAVLLSFDDGYRSFYDRVYPLLLAYGWPAVLAPVGVWVDPPDNGGTVSFGGQPVPRERFLTWSQITEMAASGLVEVAAHTNNLHYGITANPQGNQQPAAAARRYDPATGQYENDMQYSARIRDDVRAISQKISTATGKAPRVWVWPYGATSGVAASIIESEGYRLLLTLEDGLASMPQMNRAPRLLVSNDPTLTGFANAVVAQERPDVMRGVHVRLADIYDPDPAKTDENLGALVQRIADLQITTVFLDATDTATPDNTPPAVYFPNSQRPVRADLFNRVAWQLRSRAFVDVYAYLPQPADTTLYEDLARYAIFAGLALDDSASDPTANQALRDHDIIQRVKAIRGQETRIARILRVEDNAPAEHTQRRLNLALASADWVLLAPSQHNDAQKLNVLADAVQHSVAPARAAVTLPAGTDDTRLAGQMKHLQTRGVRSYTYRADDNNPDTPRLSVIRPVLSNAWYPFK